VGGRGRPYGTESLVAALVPDLDGTTDKHFALVARRLGDAYLIRVRGEVDVATAPQVRRALGSAITVRTNRVVLDLCAVRFIDSTGLQALLNAQRRLSELHRRFVVVCPSGPVRRAFEIANLMGTFSVKPSLEAALAT
jgi:anti-sigma B factor antagonist